MAHHLIEFMRQRGLTPFLTSVSIVGVTEATSSAVRTVLQILVLFGIVHWKERWNKGMTKQMWNCNIEPSKTE